MKLSLQRLPLPCLIMGLLFTLALGACQVQGFDPYMPPTAVPPTSTPTAVPTATATPEPLPTPPDEAVLPDTFQSDMLLKSVLPETYFENTCEYLQARWDPDNSAPGTIVLPVMYHGVGKRANHGRGDTWTPLSYFRRTMEKAKELGYETVTTEQVADFLEFNAPIPERSLLFIVDDRNMNTVEEAFMPVLKKNDWTVTLGWIVSGSTEGMWQRQERLQKGGHLEVQSHGFRHLYMVNGTPEDKIRKELFGPIPIQEEKVGYRPTAFIWPGGNFTKHAVDIGREAEYRTGYTAYSRGPLMFNWIPQGAAEREVGDPLMLLPRYWGFPGMVKNLEIAAGISAAAKEHAMENYAREAEFFSSYCGGKLPDHKQVDPTRN